MSEFWIDQLRSPDAAARRAAIAALAQTGDRAALPALDAVCRADPVLDLRLLAFKAMRDIEQRVPATNPDFALTDTIIPTPPPDAPPRRRRQLGRFYFNAALNYYMDGDTPRTIENLGKALGHDPDLARERYVKNLVWRVIDGDYDDALGILTDDARRDALIAQLGGKRKLQRRQDHGAGADSVTWTTVGREAALLLGLAIVAAVLLVLFVPSPLVVMFDSFSYRITGRIAARLDAVRDAALYLRVGGAALTGAGFVAAVLAFSVLIDAVAAYAQAGSGTCVYLTRQIVRLHGGVVIVGTVSCLLLMLIHDLPLRMGVLSFVGVVEIVIYIVLLSAITGYVYEFDALTGCYTLGIVQLALAALVVAGYALIRSLW